MAGRPVSFEVAVDTASFRGAAYRNVTGVLAIRLDGIWFPEKVWSDFPVIVLGWWMSQTGQVSRGEAGEFVFMDGPFRFHAYPNRDVVRVVLEDHHADPAQVIAEGDVELERFRSAIIEAARATVGACDESGWISCDLDDLRSQLGSATTQR